MSQQICKKLNQTFDLKKKKRLFKDRYRIW